MLGPKQEAQSALFYEFSIDDHVPQDHLLRSIDRFVDLSDIRQYLSDFYSHTGRPSIARQCIENARDGKNSVVPSRSTGCARS